MQCNLGDSVRDALFAVDPQGTFIRHPPKPFQLDTDVTPDSQLFQTIHMGAAVVDTRRWKLVMDGMVEQPLTVSLAQLLHMPKETITAFHECYGSPIAPPTTALWRIGNVVWAGVSLRKLLELAGPVAAAKYVWSEGFDSGIFAGVTADRYQKDLKAMSREVLLAYEINGARPSKERGGPVRLIVPGWRGTNSTKWLCHSHSRTAALRARSQQNSTMKLTPPILRTHD